MPEEELDARLKPWGNSLGIVVPAAVARRLQAGPGTTVHVTIRHTPGRNDPDKLPNWDWGGRYDVDRILEEDT